MNRKTLKVATTAICAAVTLSCIAARREPTEGAVLHRFSTTVEKERPQLDELTKSLISAYRRDPSEVNRAALERQVEINYDKVLSRKRAKLEELRREAGPDKIKEMEDIVNEMISGRKTRIAQSMARFTDSRLKPGVRESSTGYHPVLGAADNVSIAHKNVTAAEYARFCRATGRKVPATSASDEPATNLTLADAQAYCAWLTKQDSTATYRLPTAEEWELAAGHMPKDADFATIEGASGAVDFWGKVWQLTTTRVGKSVMVKGGAKDSSRTRCRTEIRDELRDVGKSYANVGFRVIRETKSTSSFSLE